MFDSGVTANDLINNLRSEIDISLAIPVGSFVIWINTIEQLLYTEIIKEQKQYKMTLSGNTVKLTEIPSAADEKPVLYEDILKVYANKVELTPANIVQGIVFPNTYYKENNNITIATDFTAPELRIIYMVRPIIKSVSTITTLNVMLPYEFLELINAKIRGEMYKLVNEESVGAKWINDYNVLLESFRVWLDKKREKFKD